MSGGEFTIHDPAIKTIPKAFFPRPKREVSSSDRSRWQQFPQKYIRAEMRMMMAINAIRFRIVKPFELLELGRHYISK